MPSAADSTSLPDHHARARGDGRSAVRARPPYPAARLPYRHSRCRALGGDLREDRVGALPDLGAGGQHADACLRPSPSTATIDARCTSPDPVKPAPCMNVAKPIPFLRRRRRVLARERCALGVVVATARARDRAVACHVDRLPDRLADGERVARRDEIAAAELVGRQADCGGNRVHVPLEREDALRRAEPAEGAMRRNVGRDRPAANANVRAAVRARPRGSCRATARPATACSTRRRRSTKSMSMASEPPVARDGGPVTRARRMTLGRRRHVLGRGRKSSSRAGRTSTRAARRVRR